MNERAMTIAGECVRGDQVFDVENPATAEPFAAAPDCTRDQLDRAMTAAQDAFASWRLDEDARRNALRAIAQRIDAEAERLTPLLVREHGKPLGDAVLELKATALWFSYYADLDLPDEPIQDDDTALVKVTYRPLCVVAAITPWNFPVALASWKVAPALRAGNTVMLKPSPFTPLTTLALGELLLNALPRGVLNVVSGSDPLGAWMTEHPITRKISFTGSTSTGMRFAAAAAADLKRTTLELGGNDAAIVLDDAEPERVAAGLFAGAFANCGQVCVAIKRAYVPSNLYSDVVEALAELARNVTVGDGFEPGVTMGPINNRPQFERIAGLVADARARGGRVVAGGEPGQGGYFYQPAIVADVSDGVALVDDEQFGPVLPVVRYSTVDDAIRRANSTNFGLSGSVWSSDPDRAAAVAAQLDCGTTWINTHQIVGPHQPFGGHKWSGVGLENGVEGLKEFTNLVVLHRARV